MKRESTAQSRVERLLFFISLALVLGVVGLLIWVEVAPGPRGSLVTGAITKVDRAGDRLTVHYAITNHGDEAIEEVQVRISAGEEEVSQPMSHLPMGITRRGVAVLDRVPAEASPEVRVEGYLLP